MVAELVAEMIRQDSSIQCPYIKTMKQLLNQFADDMDLSTKYDQASLTAVLDHLERFRSSTGFTLSYDKTTVMRIGSLKDSDAELYSQKKLNWTNDSITVLGVEVVNGTVEALLERNYAPIVLKVKNILSSWDEQEHKPNWESEHD